MTLINRYVLSAFLRLFLLSLAAFVAVYLLIDFFEKVDDFIEHRAAVSLYLLYFLNKIPLIVAQVVPLAVLMSVFMTIGGLSRTSELTAMRAGGMSLLRITLPLLAIALLISLLVLGANESLVPASVQASNHIMQVQVAGRKDQSRRLDRLWLREKGAIVQIRLALPEQNALQDVTVFDLDEQARPLTRIDAPRASYQHEQWVLEEAQLQHFDPVSGEVRSVETRDRLPFALSKAPKDFRATAERNEELGIRELHALAARVRAEGYDPTRFLVDLHGRSATPFASFIMAFIGIPFALQRKRGGSLAIGIGLSIAIGIGYHLLQGVLLAFGYSAALPPLVAAWAPNLLFGLIGIWMLLMTRE